MSDSIVFLGQLMINVTTRDAVLLNRPVYLIRRVTLAV